MSQNSPIGWTDDTWPIVAGCDYESPGCSNCWAVRDSWRLAHNPHQAVRQAFEGTVMKRADGKLVWTGLVRPLHERLDWPLRWRGARVIFVCSQADLFNPKVPFEFVAAAFGVMAARPEHTFQVLTKHPGRMREFFEWLEHERGDPLGSALWRARCAAVAGGWIRLWSSHEPYADDRPAWPLPNVWVGVTVEDQRRADERIPELLRCPAAVRWLSVEPMLEAIDLTDIRTWEDPEDGERGHRHELGDLDWVVCGGESAQTRDSTRAFDIGWARALRDQCKAAGVAFFMKQLGTKPLPEVLPGTVILLGLPRPTGKSSRYKWHEPEHWPEDLRVQEYPST